MLGRRAASRRYTYGFGRAEDLAGVFIVAMIALSAAAVGAMPGTGVGGGVVR